MSGSRSNTFAPLPYQASQPWAIEGQLASQLGSPQHPLALNALLAYGAERDNNQQQYQQYMAGIHGLQAENMRGNQAALLREDALKLVPELKTPGIAEHAWQSSVLHPLMGGDPASTADAFGRQLAQAEAFSKTGSGMGAMANAGALPYAGQTYNAPFGLIGGTTGESPLVSGNIARQPGDSSVTTRLPDGTPLISKDTTRAGAPVGGAGVGPRPGNVGPVGGPQQETALPGATQPQAQPSAKQAGSPAQGNSTTVDQVQKQKLTQDMFRRIAAHDPKKAKDIQAGGMQATIQGTKIVFIGASGTPYQYDTTK